MPEYLRASQIAEILGISPAAVYVLSSMRIPIWKFFTKPQKRTTIIIMPSFVNTKIN